MARPKKVGLEYFPLDCKMDDKVEILEAEYGLEGFAVYIKLLQEIYQTDEGVLDMSVVFRWKTLGKRYGIDGKQLENIINLCLEVGLFCKVCYADGQKLTSNGVKKRIGKVADMRNKDRSRKSDQPEGFSDGKLSENPRKSTQKEKEKEKESTKRTGEASDDAKGAPQGGVKPKAPKQPAAELTFPSFAGEQFKQAWAMLLTAPKWKGKTANALQLSLNKLAKYNEPFAVELMQLAVEHNWQGVVYDNTAERWQQHLADANKIKPLHPNGGQSFQTYEDLLKPEFRQPTSHEPKFRVMS